jgi:hypothetical protein
MCGVKKFEWWLSVTEETRAQVASNHKAPWHPKFNTSIQRQPFHNFDTPAFFLLADTLYIVIFPASSSK